MDWTHFVVALLTAAGSAGGAGLVAIPKLAAARRAGRKDALEEWQTLYQTEKERNAELRSQVDQLKARVRELETELTAIRAQLGGRRPDVV